MRTRTLTQGAAGYPLSLWRWSRMTGARPPPLYLRGELPAKPGVAIVGTRKPTPEGQRFAGELAAAGGRAGYAVWSGGAKGIDGCAHRVALEVGAPTVVVMAGGLDRPPYPRSHRDLFRQVLDAGGAWLSLNPDGTRRYRSSFLARNGVIAALSVATVMVQGDERSGACNAMDKARRMGRPTFAVPHAPWEERGRGCLLQMAHGAIPVGSALEFVDGVRRLAEEDAPGGLEEQQLTLFEEPSDDGHRVLAALSDVPTHIDRLCERCALPYPRVATRLADFIAHGIVVEPTTGYYRRMLWVCANDPQAVGKKR